MYSPALAAVISAWEGGSAVAGVPLPILTKIEKPEALEASDDILAATDAVMAERGDMGVEVPPD